METSVNNKCKAFTSLEQSRKLAEILPIESADMVYIKHSTSSNQDWRFDDDIPPMILGKISIKDMTVEVLPCWSLAALLSVLPKIHKLKPILDLEENSIQYSGVDLYVIGENLVDACYEMILKLHELDLV